MSSKEVIKINRCINDIIAELLPDVDALDVYGCTNYMDKRTLYMLKYMDDHKVVIPRTWRMELARSLEEFLDYVEANGGAYFIPSSGTYTLEIPAYALRECVRVLRIEEPEAR